LAQLRPFSGCPNICEEQRIFPGKTLLSYSQGAGGERILEKGIWFITFVHGLID
jgi:hypothetical protein